MARSLYKSGILRIRHFVSIDGKLIEVDLALRLLIEPSLTRSSNERPRRDDDEFFLQRLLGCGRIGSGTNRLVF